MIELRALTQDELIENLIDSLRASVDLWAAVNTERDIKERLMGLLHSTLVILDGCGDGPSYDLVASVHSSDKEDCIENGENWIESGTVISTMLHEHLYKTKEVSE